MEQSQVYLTRKIQLRINHTDVDFKKNCYKKLYEWQWICFRAANYIMSHHYLQDQIKDLFYITDGAKVKLTNIKKDKDGILTTSKENTTYQLLSKFFKGEVPMAIIAALNHDVQQHFQIDRDECWHGTRSIRNYKRDISMPFPGKSLKINAMEIGRDFAFNLFGIPFKTNLGRDKSDKSVLLKRYMAGTLKICKCYLKLIQNKIYLLPIFQMDKKAVDLDEANIAEASLSLDFPITLSIGKSIYQIGSKEEFLFRRIALQNARKRLQVGSTYNSSGRGYKRKLKSVLAYKDKEKRYIDHKLHVYSRQVIKHCLKNKAGTLLLVNQEQKEEIAKSDSFLLRNWSYFGLKEKLAYKAKLVGITIIAD